MGAGPGQLERGLEAIPPAVEAVELFGRLGRPSDLLSATYWLALAHNLSGSVPEARRLLVEVLDATRSGCHRRP